MFEIFRKYIDSRVSVTEPEFERIVSVGRVKKLRKRQFLLQEGDVWRYHAFVMKGLVRLYWVNEKGVEHTLNFAKEEWWTGDRESLLSETPSRFSIDAIEDSEILVFHKTDFERVCEEIPVFKEMVYGIIEKSFVASQNRILNANRFTAEEKYADLITRYPDFDHRVPLHMIASYLGMTPESLSRIRGQRAKR